MVDNINDRSSIAKISQTIHVLLISREKWEHRKRKKGSGIRVARSRLINTTKEKTFEPGKGNWINKIFPLPPSLLSMTMTVEIAFPDSNVVKTRVDRARWKSRRILIALSFFAARPIVPETRSTSSDIVFFFFIFIVPRLGIFLRNFSPPPPLFFHPSARLLPLFLSQKAISPEHDGFVFRIKYASRARSVLSASLLEERTSLSGRTALSPVRTLINRHFHYPVCTLLNCAGCHRRKIEPSTELARSVGKLTRSVNDRLPISLLSREQGNLFVAMIGNWIRKGVSDEYVD